MLVGQILVGYVGGSNSGGTYWWVMLVVQILVGHVLWPCHQRLKNISPIASLPDWQHLRNRVGMVSGMYYMSIGMNIYD